MAGLIHDMSENSEATSGNNTFDKSKEKIAVKGKAKNSRRNRKRQKKREDAVRFSYFSGINANESLFYNRDTAEEKY